MNLNFHQYIDELEHVLQVSFVYIAVFSRISQITPHCWGRLVFFQPLSKIHASPQYLEDLEWFEAILKIFALAVFEVIEVKGRSRLNFEAATSKFCNHLWKFGYQPRKSKADLCMTKSSKVLIYLTLISFFLQYLQE